MRDTNYTFFFKFIYFLTEEKINWTVNSNFKTNWAMKRVITKRVK